MKANRPTVGIALMVLTSMIFAAQDGISRHLAVSYNVVMIVMLRYWFYAGFALAWGATRPGGLRAVGRSARPLVQVARGVILIVEIVIAITAFVYLGLVQSLAIFGLYPLIVAALSGPVLGEPVGWRRWTAIVVGFVGLLIILRPGLRVFDPAAVLPLVSAFLFALYQLLTRLVADLDRPRTSFFWTGVAGAAVITLAGPFFWEPMSAPDWGWMAALAVSGVVGHFCLIAALDAAEAATVQPFSYLHLVFASAIGIVVFGESVDRWTVIGAVIIVASGVFTLLRQGRRPQR